MPTNEFGQPIGPPLPDWTPRPHPPPTIMAGRLCRLEPLTAQRHGSDLYDAIGVSPDDRRWTYLPYGPFAGADTYREFRHALVYRHRSRDTAWFSITDLEWPDRRAAFEAWLSPENFDAGGAQRWPLSDFMPARVSAYDRVSADGGSQ